MKRKLQDSATSDEGEARVRVAVRMLGGEKIEASLTSTSTAVVTLTHLVVSNC